MIQKGMIILENKNCFYLLVVGLRDFTDKKLCFKILNVTLKNHNNDKIIIVSGGAKGADSLAEEYAAIKGYETKIFKADWGKYGKKAGYLRNREMHDYISKQNNRGIIAFWNGQSKGTAQNFYLAKEFQNPLRVYNYAIKKVLKDKNYL